MRSVAAVVALMSWAALAQGVPPAPRSVEVTNTIAADVRFVGQTGNVSVTGTLGLDDPSLEELNEPYCPPLSMGHVGVDGTVRPVPPSAHASRTKLLVVSHASSGFVACRTGPSVGYASPSCTLPAAGVLEEGALMFPGASLSLDITASTILRCVNCTAGGVPSGLTINMSFLEPSCI